MCGIAGVLAADRPADSDVLARMAGRLRHRGPDDVGVLVDRGAGLTCARLSIVDLAGGGQPIPNEDGTVWVVCNGEIFNHEELRARLTERGHRFRSRSDAEVVVHLYEEAGTGFLADLNGEFAIAVWDSRRQRLILARDRFGIRPLFYTRAGGDFLFGSEIKAFHAHPDFRPAADPVAINQFFTFWTTVGSRTMVAGVEQVKPGTFLVHEDGRFTVGRYWETRVDAPSPGSEGDEGELVDRLRESVRLRLGGDVPVAVYLSGGIDSATIAYLAQELSPHRISTFSVAFTDRALDESDYQNELVSALGTDHHELICTPDAIGEVFPDVVRHAEMPVIRTAAAPLYLLSRAVQEQGFKVVLSGEGADELLLGYDVYRAALLRELAADGDARMPCDVELLRYTLAADPYVLGVFPQAGPDELWAAIRDLGQRADTLFGVHSFRWDRMSSYRRYLSPDVRDSWPDDRRRADLLQVLPHDFARLDPLHRAQHLDFATLLSGYLLSSQGDRMAMAHSVEARVPFLDHHLVEWAARIPPTAKLAGLVEKAPLKAAMDGRLPAGTVHRRKHAYTAPAMSAFAPAKRDYVREMLSDRTVDDLGIFDRHEVRALIDLGRRGALDDEHYVSPFVAVLSTQLLFAQMFTDSRSHPATPAYRLMTPAGQT